MERHLQREINKLKAKLIELCTLVEENVTTAVISLETRSEDGSKKVFRKEDLIDEKEIELEEDCLKIFALYQPVAGDLRFIVSVLKINNDLERIGDMALHIMERFQSLEAGVGKSFLQQLTQNSKVVRNMLRMRIDSLVDMDIHKAKLIGGQDEKVNAFHENFFSEIKDIIQKDPDNVNTYMNLLFISKQLERIGDHATNIAEDVIYLVEGHIVRHHHMPD